MQAKKAHHSLKLGVKMKLRAAFKFLSPLYRLRNRIRCNEAWVIVLASRFHTRELVEQLASQGHKIFLFDSSPDQANWRFACRSCALDIYDRAYVPVILKTARNLGCNTVLMPQDDNLIPIYAEVNRLLDNDTRFSEDAVQASISKTFMRTKLTEAGMEVPAWKIIKGADDIAAVPFPAVVKPPYGQGSKGITYVKSEAEAGIAVKSIFNDLGQAHCIIEEFLTGRQFDVEGVIQDGTPHVHLITEECYTDFLPEFTKPSWYLHGPDLPEDMKAEILRETFAALAACDFYSGAFHLELKFQGDRAMAIDLANRMGADFFKYTKLVTGIPAVHEYYKSMNKGVLDTRLLDSIPRHPVLRFFNYIDRPANAAISDLAKSLSEEGRVKLSVFGNQLELAGNDSELRNFLKQTYALGQLLRKRVHPEEELKLAI